MLAYNLSPSKVEKKWFGICNYSTHVCSAGLLYGLEFRKGYSVTFISSIIHFTTKVVKWHDDDQIH